MTQNIVQYSSPFILQVHKLKQTNILLRGIVAEPHKWCGTDFLDLASLDPLWNTPSWDIKNGILEKFFLHSGGLAQLIF